MPGVADLKVVLIHLDVTGLGAGKRTRTVVEVPELIDAELVPPPHYASRDRDRKASEQLKLNFQYLDTNGDGFLDLKESEVMVEYANKEQ